MNKAKLTSLVLLLIFVLCRTALAAEEIVSFHQNITVEKNSDIKVKETVKINVENINVVHGIKRVFPTDRKDMEGRWCPIGLEIEQALLDGEPVSYETDDNGSDTVVKIGSSDVVIPCGIHSFTLIYTAKGEIGFFDDHDELYWNATGNEWKFPIRKASCEIQLPGMNPGEGFEKIAWYTGEYGGSDKTGAKLTETHGVKTVRPLAEGEGLTVVYGWKKGIVEEPPLPALPALDDAATHTVVAVCVFAAILCWLIFAWCKWGKDPQKTVIPLFSAPDGISPAAIAYAHTLKFESKALLSANIIDIAVKGLLTIERTGGERKIIFKRPVSYTLHKKEGSKETLTPDEAKIYAKLFDCTDTLIVSQENADILIAAKTAAKMSCKTQLGKLYDSNGEVFVVAAIIYAIGVALLWLKSGEEFPVDMFVCGLVGFMSFLPSMFISRSPAAVKFRNFALRILLQTVIVLIGGFLVFGSGNNLLPFTLFSASLYAVTIFSPLMSARNEHGAELYAAAEGLKLYMTTAEKDRLEMLNSPEETPQLFEKLLPYALALGVAKTWADRFSGVLSAAEYKPEWCYGGGMVLLPYDFASSFGHNISTATMPASQQSFGGSWGSGFDGGFSGGGGGGGGGSGW